MKELAGAGGGVRGGGPASECGVTQRFLVAKAPRRATALWGPTSSVGPAPGTSLYATPLPAGAATRRATPPTPFLMPMPCLPADLAVRWDR